jgi:ATP-dependent Clp protease protease subunit
MDKSQISLATEMRLSAALKYRKVYLSDEVDRESIFEVLYFLDRIQEIDKKSKSKEPIEIILDSYGGYIYHGLSLISKILELRDLGYYIISTVTGVGMSMGFMIPIVASERRIYRYGTLMCHQPNSGTWGTLQEQQEDIQETIRLWNILKEIICKYTKITDAQLEDIKTRKFDWFMTPQQALELGCVDKII